ncbi:uncharacterized protein LOC128682308 [Plodia interpunctella]|uniref:uncharacterized protein LOC128682308 n=1 Tax=Plodia interpunctella TaxID=58824 RepID=UPI00236842F6|nr:uncharacterized protein LOC128682308 [Plodia interpunctella]
MGSTSKRTTTSSVRYTFSDDEHEPETGTQKNAGKTKKTGKSKMSVCKICNKRYSDPRHIEVHRDTLDFTCGICDKQFKTSRYLYRHHKLVHAPAPHECDRCGKRFPLPTKLRQHMLLHTGEKPHKCSDCGKSFRALYSLNTHRLLHTNEKPYKCQYCPYACRDNSTLRRHHERHTGTLVLFQCSDCGRKFDNRSKLKTHVLERHFADQKMVPCPQCSGKFRSDVSLKKHIRMVHEKAFTAKCEVCDAEISSRYNMAAHLRKHLQVKPYRCRYKQCNKRFKDMNSLKKHSRIHKPDEQYSCDVCGRLFARRHRLNTHMRQHGDDTKWNTRFKVLFCDHCGFSFDNKPCLVRHMLKHIRHRNTYVCDICKYVTHRKLSIEKHMTYGHGDEDDVYCKICDKNYLAHAYLILHYYNRHGIRYKTVKRIKLETSVMIKEEPQEPVPDAEVDLEDIQKQKSLAEIITDVALDRDATDITYSKSVLKEDLCRTNIEQFPNRFRKKLKGRASLFDEQNTLYARKEKDVKKKIDKLLSRVRLRKWTEILERARQQYNERIRAIPNTAKENNLKIKHVNFNRANNNDVYKKDTGNKLDTDNAKESSYTNNKEIDRDGDKINDETDIDSVEMSKTYDDKDSDIIDNDGSVGDTTPLINAHEINRDVPVANVYEDVLDIEDNPIGIKTNTNGNNINRDVRNSFNASDSDNLHYNSNSNKIDDTRVNSEEKNVNLKNITSKYEEMNQSIDSTSKSNEGNGAHDNRNDIHATDNSETNEQIHDAVDEYVPVNNNGSESIVNVDKEERAPEMTKKNVKLKINTHQCYVCYKLYETKKKLLDHCQEHFDICTDIPLKKCPLCNYVTKLQITRHIKLVHGINIKLPFNHINDKHKNSTDSSRYFYNINDKVVKEIEIIPSVKNLNKIAYVKIDKNNRINKDLAVAKTKLVKKSGEWVVEHENINLKNANTEFILPEFDKTEIKKLKYVGDQYLDVIKALGRLATKHKAKMLYPCNGCDKLCKTFAALKLHSRRHESNPKPFKKKVWKHKTQGFENKVVKTVNTRKIDALERVRQAKPKPIANKHRCDKTLMDFYENNVKGADIEFWQFLKIYNRMNREHADNLKDLKETNEFGDYITEETPLVDNVATEMAEPSENTSKIVNNKPKIRNRFVRKLILSKEERLRRVRIKEQLRRKLINNN